MVFKRSLCEEEEDEGFTVGNQQTKRRIISSTFAQNVTRGLSTQELASTLEPLIRRWVRDEVQRACQSFFRALPMLDLERSCVNVPEPCKKTSLQLRFEANLPNTFFTGSRIESKEKIPIKVMLFDVNSNRIVSTGPFSSLKVEIVPLDGDFLADDDDDWAEKDFDAKVISARDGRRPLMTGDLVVTLQNGVADLGELCFTDNSSWRRSSKFMIGARVRKDACVGSRIREAKSQAFRVKDHRGESYQKHHPPHLNDEVWRLEKIAKDGVFNKRLESNRISTVKDFLQVYVTNESSLRKLLGGSSNKTWDAIIKHARECVLDDKLYIHRCGVDGTGLLLNSVMTVVGATFDGQTFHPLDTLSTLQRPVVEALKDQVYKNLAGTVPVDASSVFEASMPVSNIHHAPTANIHHEHVKNTNHEVGMHKMYGMVDNSSFIIKELISGAYDQDLAAVGIDNLQAGTSLWQGNEMFIDPGNQTIDIVSSDFGICYTSNGSPRARWCKIRAALKWDSVRRDVAAKKMAESYLDFSV
ncbi:hypothetical protein R6Q59_023077 [Mikania micrantha]|uniref:Uncharacterized protein n=1 Tax=Mikania micrantha TaxID=192012 RepID=A0A5N6MZW5_9ASTR|nr:hypothetical protein E3N88_28171 [Mikania micrantha]